MKLKALLLTLLMTVLLSSINAGWHERWVSIKNYFSQLTNVRGYRLPRWLSNIKSPHLTTKGKVALVGGVGALAVVGVLRWYNQPRSKKTVGEEDEKMIDKLRKDKDLELNSIPEEGAAKPLLEIPNNPQKGNIVTLVHGGKFGSNKDFVSRTGKITSV